MTGESGKEGRRGGSFHGETPTRLVQLPCPWVSRGCSGHEGGGSHLPSASAPRGGVLRHTSGAVHLPGSTGVL